MSINKPEQLTLTAKFSTVTYENNEKKMESIYSIRLRAGKRRTYFFDVRTTRANDFFLTITESRKRFNDNGYDRHKIFLYKEDFNKFIKALNETVDHVKTELMPDFDFDAFNHDEAHEDLENHNGSPVMEENPEAVSIEAAEKIAEPLPVAESKVENTQTGVIQEEVDKW